MPTDEKQAGHFVQICGTCGTVIMQCRCPGPKTTEYGQCERCRERMGGRGFTLIELMIMVAICGILVAIAIPQIQAIRTKAKMTPTQRAEQYDIEVFCKLMGVTTYDFARSKLLQKKFDDFKAGRFNPGKAQG